MYLEKVKRDQRPASQHGWTRQKLTSLLGKEKHDNIKEKIEQYIAFIRPSLSDSSSQVQFDRIIRINNIPIIVPTKLELSIIQDHKTRCNPTGLYVNGATEYSHK